MLEQMFEKEETSMGDRVILHCDLDNFFASVECTFRPEL